MILVSGSRSGEYVYATVDDEDEEIVSKYTWHLVEGTNTRYARHQVIVDYVHIEHIYMHNLILPKRKGFQVDHKDLDGLNNRRGNLRYSTRSQQQANTSKRQGTTSKYKGVSYRKDNNKWVAFITSNFYKEYLGQFSNELDAARAYNTRAVELFGDFARINEV